MVNYVCLSSFQLCSSPSTNLQTSVTVFVVYFALALYLCKRFGILCTFVPVFVVCTFQLNVWVSVINATFSMCGSHR